MVKYLKSTMDLGLNYSANSDLQLQAYCDADWSSYVFRCKSLSSSCMFSGSHLVPWKIKTQKIVSKPSAETDYISMSSAAFESCVD